MPDSHEEHGQKKIMLDAAGQSVILEDSSPEKVIKATIDATPGFRLFRKALLIAAIIVVCIGCCFLYFFTSHADPTEIFVFSSARYRPDKPFTAFVFVRNGRNGTAMKNCRVSLKAGLKNQPLRKLPPVVTGKDGMALVHLEGRPSGLYTLKAAVGAITASKIINVDPVYKCMVTTDKPIYQPGQKIRLRTLTLNAIDQHPAPVKKINVTIKDSRDNLVFAETLKASEFGIAATDFRLASQVNTGKYKINVDAGLTRKKTTVEVKPYRLPDFKINVETGKKFYGPGQLVTGTVHAEYLWGKPVADAKLLINVFVTVKARDKNARDIVSIFGDEARVLVRTNKLLKTIKGKTDAKGNFSFRLKLPGKFSRINFKDEDSACSLEITAVSASGRKQEFKKKITISKRPLRIDFIPEYGKQIRGISSGIYVLTSDPDGNPVPAILDIEGKTVRTDENGITLVKLASTHGSAGFVIEAQNHDGYKTVRLFTPKYESGDALVIKPEKSVYRQGEELNLEIGSTNSGGRIFVNIVKDNTSLKIIPVELKRKKAKISFRLSPEMVGTLQLHAYQVSSNARGITRDFRLIQVLPGDNLKISAKFSKPEYRPGDFVKVDFDVKDKSGSPAIAALSVSAVDEAVFALRPRKTVSERIYFLLQEELLKPEYQLNAAPALMPLEYTNTPFGQTFAGYLLEQCQNMNNLQVSEKKSYKQREHALVRKKIKYGNILFVILISVSSFVYLLIAVPFAFGIQNLNSEQYALVTARTDWKKVQRRLSAIMAMSFIAMLILIFFIVIRSGMVNIKISNAEDSLRIICSGMVIFGMIVLWIFTWRSWRALFGYFRTSYIQNLQKILLLVPYISGMFIFVFMLLVLAWIFFPNAPHTGMLSIIFLLISLVPMISINAAQVMICTKEHLEMKKKFKAGLGMGIGRHPRPYSKVWIFASMLSVGPVVAIYLAIMITVLAMFLPFICIVEKLGGGGGGR